MNKDIIKGNWKVIKGQLKQRWASITDDDILKMEGTEEELAGTLERRYGYGKDQAKKEIKNFIDQNGLCA